MECNIILCTTQYRRHNYLPWLPTTPNRSASPITTTNSLLASTGTPLSHIESATSRKNKSKIITWWPIILPTCLGNFKNNKRMFVLLKSTFSCLSLSHSLCPKIMETLFSSIIWRNTLPIKIKIWNFLLENRIFLMKKTWITKLEKKIMKSKKYVRSTDKTGRVTQISQSQSLKLAKRRKDC